MAMGGRVLISVIGASLTGPCSSAQEVEDVGQQAAAAHKHAKEHGVVL